MPDPCSECGQVPTGDNCPVRHPLCPVFDYEPPTEAPEKALIGKLIGGRYKVESVLGKGGFGTVFAAKHATTRQDLVVKVLRAEMAADKVQVKRFFNEAMMTSQLTHPHTVRVFDFGHTDNGLLYIAMERLNGDELARVLKREGKFEPRRAVRIACAVLESLAEAHAAGLVHRDLKPSNIFLCEVHGERDYVKLLDFGIAKSFEDGEQDNLTQTGFAVGTPKYMSPEQGRAEPLDARSDLYSLGIILYEALSGETPFQARSAMSMIVKHLQEPPPPLSGKLPELPSGLSSAVMKALAKSPWERFSDADDMRAALEEVLERMGEAVPAGQRAVSARLRAVPSDGDQEDGETRALPTPAAGLLAADQGVHDDATRALNTQDRLAAGAAAAAAAVGPAAGDAAVGAVDDNIHDDATKAVATPERIAPATAAQVAATPPAPPPTGGASPKTPRAVTDAPSKQPAREGAKKRKPRGMLGPLAALVVLGGGGFVGYQVVQGKDVVAEGKDVVAAAKKEATTLRAGIENTMRNRGLTPSGQQDKTGPAHAEHVKERKEARAAEVAAANAKGKEPPLTVQEIDAVAHKSLRAYRDCYRKNTKKLLNFQRIRVDVTIASDGTVKRAAHDADDAGLGKCFESVAHRMRFRSNRERDEAHQVFVELGRFTSVKKAAPKRKRRASKPKPAKATRKAAGDAPL